MSKHTPGHWVVEEWDVREPDGCVINGGLQVVAIKNWAKCSIYAATEDGDGTVKRREGRGNGHGS